MKKGKFYSCVNVVSWFARLPVFCLTFSYCGMYRVAKPATPTRSPQVSNEVGAPPSPEKRMIEFSKATRRNSLQRWLKKASCPTIRCLHCEAILKPNETSTHWCAHASSSSSCDSLQANANSCHSKSRRCDYSESKKPSRSIVGQHLSSSSSSDIEVRQRGSSASSSTKNANSKVKNLEENYFFLPDRDDNNHVANQEDLKRSNKSQDNRFFMEKLEVKGSPIEEADAYHHHHSSIVKHEDIDPWTALALDQQLVDSPLQKKLLQAKQDATTTTDLPPKAAAAAVDEVLQDKPENKPQEEVEEEDKSKNLVAADKDVNKNSQYLNQEPISELFAFPTIGNAFKIDMETRSIVGDVTSSSRPRARTMPTNNSNPQDFDFSNGLSSPETTTKPHSDSVDMAMFYSNFGPAP
jgi:hypothetical protein